MYSTSTSSVVLVGASFTIIGGLKYQSPLENSNNEFLEIY
jgi:hypothetical protein